MSAPRLLIAALLLPGLTACDDVIRNDAAAGLEQGRRLTAAERARQAAVQRGEILRETRPFYGTAVEVTRGAVSGAPLPEAVEGARGFSLALHGQADVETIAAAITSATEIPVNIRTRYIVAAEGGPGEVIEVPIGTRMAAAWDGPLSGFLDRMGARMDVAWSYDGAVITIDRMTRRSWRLALPIGATTVTDSNESEQTGLSVTSTRALDPWAELGRRLAPLAPAPAQVTFSPEAGRVDVFGPPSVISAAGKVLDDVAATAATRIGLEIAVYWVDTDRADSFGVGINASRAIGPFNVSSASTAAEGRGPCETAMGFKSGVKNNHGDLAVDGGQQRVLPGARARPLRGGLPVVSPPPKGWRRVFQSAVPRNVRPLLLAGPKVFFCVTDRADGAVPTWPNAERQCRIRAARPRRVHQASHPACPQSCLAPSHGNRPTCQLGSMIRSFTTHPWR